MSGQISRAGGSGTAKQAADNDYVVVARRYRPQTFEDLIGQDQSAQALRNAIATHRVGHAYLFTGARGVGKTSTARIFAKALNCVNGPTSHPCNACDICLSVSAGNDVDVLEIDGASNRGIDEIRQLRSNVNVRPSRSRFKIYIIDEVHMLTKEAFNALLKTLEEPPGHVKFIFCTTDPEKIPITVLSRCQRFDFIPVETSAIIDRLKFIVTTEGAQAEDEALQMIARRASGSMRDSQSLLEQLLSFCGEMITAADVHRMLGTAPTRRLATITQCILARDTARTLGELSAAIDEGIDPGQLAEQLLGYFRDMLAAVAGCGPELMLMVANAEYQELLAAGRQLGLETLLAIAQILDQSLVKMRQSMHVRTLLEIALIRICQLENLSELASLIQRLTDGVPAGSVPASLQLPARPANPPSVAEASALVAPAAATAPATPQASRSSPGAPQPSAEPTSATPQKKTPGPGGEGHNNPTLGLTITSENVDSLWKQALADMGDITATFAGYYDRIAIIAPNRLVVSFRAGYTMQKEACERPDRRARLETALERVAGQRLRLDFDLLPDEAKTAETPPSAASATRQQKVRDAQRNPFVRRAMELFDGEVVRLEQRPSRAATAADQDA